MKETWLFLSLLCAFSLATSDALAKRALKNRDEYAVAFLRLLFSVPLLAIALYFTPLPAIGPKFYYAFFTALPLEMIALVFYVKALKASPMSLTLPFLALSPAALVVVSYFMLGEKISMAGFLGVAFIVAGGYTLNLSEFKNGIFEPFFAITRERGCIYMIITSLIYSVTSALGKMAVENSSPVFFGATFFMAMAVTMLPVAISMNRADLKAVFEPGIIKSCILPGLFYSVMVITHMTAVSMTKVAYMISVKRLSLLIGVIYGRIFFNESGIGERAIGTGLMVAGVTIIAIFQ